MKRGLSSAVTIVLLILMVILAVSIIAAFIFPLVKNPDFGKLPKITIETSNGYTVYDKMKNIACVQVKASPDLNEIVALDIIFSIKGESRTFRVPPPGELPEENNLATYCFNFTKEGIFSTPEKVAVSEVYKDMKTIAIESKIPEGTIPEVSNFYTYPEQKNCDYYASPSGTGNGLSESTPFKINDFWPLAGPGKTLCLLDGVYTAASENSVIRTYLTTAQGNSTSPLTIRALHDGKAIIDGQGVKNTVYLNGRRYWVIEGLNVKNSTYCSFAVESSSNITVRRVVAWDAKDGNSAVFCTSGSDNTLYEDCAGFGVGRKTFGIYQSNNTHYVRCFGRWEGCHFIGPKMTFTLSYDGWNNTCENCIGTWDAIRMSESYNLACFPGSTDSMCGVHYTNYQPSQPFGIFSWDGNDRDRKAGISVLGSIAYTKPGQRVSNLSGLISFSMHAGILVENSAALSSGAIKPLRVRTFNNWTTMQSSFNCPSYLGGIVPSVYAGHFYECNNPGTVRKGTTEPIWPTSPGAEVIDNEVTWKEKGALDLFLRNVTTIGQTPNEITLWEQSNLAQYSTVQDMKNAGNNIFNSASGAKICYRYENRQLTNKPLWPWPMEQRIIDAMRYAGYAEDKVINVTKDIETLFGEIPDECRKQ
jgi:hypothetical protein